MTRPLQTRCAPPRRAAPRWLAALVLAYDEPGRLVRVADTASDATVVYEYDAAGNRIAIRRAS